MKNKTQEREIKTPLSYQQPKVTETTPLPTLKSQQSALEVSSLPLNERYTLEWDTRQWILKKHYGNRLSSFCTTKEALIRNLGSDYPDKIWIEALSIIKSLPQTFWEWMKITPPPLKGEG